MKDGIVARIRTVIEYYGLSVSAFADAIGVQRSSISHLLSGRNNPSLDLILKLVQAYPDVNLYWLLREEGTFPPTKNAATAAPRVLYKTEEEQLVSQPKPYAVKNAPPASRQPSRIVVFYTNGTFESFELKKE